MEGEARPVSMTPEQVEKLVDRGVSTEDIVRLLVATGTWSEAGATEIVSTLAPRTADEGSTSAVLSWPGPLEDVPPLFTT
jgi:hypothetical protein